MASFSDKPRTLKTLSNMKEIIEEIEDTIESNMSEQNISYLVDKLANQANEIRNNYK